MGRKVISFGLSVSEINRALRELEQYKQQVIRKTELLRKRIAERLEDEVNSGFAAAVVDDLLKGGTRKPQVNVTIDPGDNVSVVIAKGEDDHKKDAVWVEFGAGVYHNGAAGSSPHPRGGELGLTIGGYGKGMGKRQVWGFLEDGELRLTRGTPAAMPMYNAMQTVCREIASIAKEVFR